MSNFSSRIIKLITSIPEGRVATYGQIAKLAGNPRGTRAVVWLLSSSSKKYALPWHRVVNSKGCISTKSEIQVQKLIAEGIKVDNLKIDLEQYIWKPKHALLDAVFDDT